MNNEAGEITKPPLGGGGNIERRGLLRLGTLASAITGALALSANSSGRAEAAPPISDKDLSATYVKAGEEWTNVNHVANVKGLDFTTALEQALVENRNVTINPGAYVLTRGITLGSNHRLKGIGGKNAAKLSTSASWDAVLYPAAVTMTGTNSRVEHLVLDATLTPAVDGIRINADYEPAISNVQVLGGANGVNLLAGLESRMDYVSIKKSSLSGIRINGVADAFFLNVSTDSCGHGFRSDGGSITAIHVHAIKSLEHGFYLTGPGSSQFYGCHADTNGKNGFHVVNPNNTRFTDCWSFKNGTAAPSSSHNWLISNSVESSLVGCGSNNETNVLNSYNFANTQTSLSLIGCTATTKDVTGILTGVEFIGCAGKLASHNTASKVVDATAGALLKATRTVVQGDSLTESFDSKLTTSYRSSWFMHAAIASNGTFRTLCNAARGGHTSSQLQSLFDSEVLAQNPTLVGLMPGRNDGLVDGFPQSMINYVTEAVAKCRARGIGVFLVNTVPQGQAALAAPTVTVEPASSTAGTVPAGMHRYVVTSGNGSAATQTGETLASAPASVTTPSNTYSIRIHWTHVPGANWYKVYKETSDGSGVYGLIGTVAPSASPSFLGTHRFIQTAAIPPGAAPPTTNTTALPLSARLERARNNAWLSHYAAKEGVPLVDVYSDLVDADTGLWKTGLTYDGTHPNGEANAIIGRKVWSTLAPLVKCSPPIITASSQDPINLASNGTFLTGDANFPTGFTATTSPTYDVNKVTNTRAKRTGFLGYAFTTTASVPVVEKVVGPTVSSGFVAGHRLLFSARVETTLATAGGSFGVILKDQGGNQLFEYKHVDVDIPPSTITKELVVPSGVTGIYPELQLIGKGPASIGQFTIYNLSTESYLA